MTTGGSTERPCARASLACIRAPLSSRPSHCPWRYDNVVVHMCVCIDACVVCLGMVVCRALGNATTPPRRSRYISSNLASWLFHSPSHMSKPEAQYASYVLADTFCSTMGTFDLGCCTRVSAVCRTRETNLKALLPLSALPRYNIRLLGMWLEPWWCCHRLGRVGDGHFGRRGRPGRGDGYRGRRLHDGLWRGGGRRGGM